MDRRNFFQNSALAASGALAGCALPGVAQQQAPTPFPVPSAAIPIVGSDEVFPVRRIYCIGRNYAAHAREMGPTRHANCRFSSRSRLMPSSMSPPAPWPTTPTRH